MCHALPGFCPCLLQRGTQRPTHAIRLFSLLLSITLRSCHSSAPNIIACRSGVDCFCRWLPFRRGGAEGHLPKEVMTLDCLVKLVLKDNLLTGERGGCASDSTVSPLALRSKKTNAISASCGTRPVQELLPRSSPYRWKGKCGLEKEPLIPEAAVFVCRL